MIRREKEGEGARERSRKNGDQPKGRRRKVNMGGKIGRDVERRIVGRRVIIRVKKEREKGEGRREKGHTWQPDLRTRKDDTQQSSRRP